MEENIKEKSIKLAIEAMRPLPVNSFAGYCILRDTPFSIYRERGGIIRMRKFDTQEW